VTLKEEIDLAPEVGVILPLLEELIGGRCGQGGTSGAIGEGKTSSTPGGSGIVEIGAWG